MARKKPKPGDDSNKPAPVQQRTGNVDNDALKSYVDRYVAVESTFQEAKAERDELVKDLKTEIKSNTAETGIEPVEVVRLAAIRLKEAEKRTELDEATEIMAVYDMIYGRSAEDDPLD